MIGRLIGVAGKSIHASMLLLALVRVRLIGYAHNMKQVGLGDNGFLSDYDGYRRFSCTWFAVAVVRAILASPAELSSCPESPWPSWLMRITYVPCCQEWLAVGIPCLRKVTSGICEW